MTLSRKHGRDEWAQIGEEGQKPYEDHVRAHMKHERYVQAKQINQKNLEERAEYKAAQEAAAVNKSLLQV